MNNPSDIGVDSPTTKDLLGFTRFAEPIADRIVHSTTHNTPLTIGIYGEWGSGKTSFLKMVDSMLQTHDIHPIWFNAWKYDQEDNLWSALIQTILYQTRVRGNWYHRVWVKVKIWSNTLNLQQGFWELTKWLLSVTLRLVVIVLGFLIMFGWSSSEISDFLNQVFERWFSNSPITLSFFQVTAIKTITAIIAFFALKPNEWIKIFDRKLGVDFSKFRRTQSYSAHIAFLDEFSEEFKRIIKLTGNGKPLVVIIDDLDRCLPEKAIQVLEAIKLFLDVEGCVFLLAVDRDVVEKAVAVKYKDLLALTKDTQSKPELRFTLLGENYFEKIVQLPFTLPLIADAQFKNFVTSVYPDEHIQQCANIFVAGLPRNPRKVKRLLQTFFLLRSFARKGIENESIHPSLIAKFIVIQSQFRDIHYDLARFPTLLAELETLYQRQADSESTESPFDEISDPILRERVDIVATQFPVLRNILTQRVHENDSFVGVDIAPYLSLTEPTFTEPTIETHADQITPIQENRSILGLYLRQIIKRSQSLNIQSITPTHSKSEADIEHLFIPTRFIGEHTGSVNSSRQSLNRATLEETEFDRSIDAFDAFKKNARLVVLGDPGSGKTIFVSYLANIFARAMLQNDTKLLVDTIGFAENLLPILVSLRTYTRYIQQRDVQLAVTNNLIDYLYHYSADSGISLPPDFFTSYFERGECILFLDGLDEVLSQETRYIVAQSIISISRRYPTVRIIVTSRLIGYTNRLSGDFTHFTIDNFSDSAIREYVEKWSQIIVSNSEEAKSLSTSLFSLISRHADLWSLAQNPLLLTTMLIIQYEHGQLPARRINLYEDSLDILLSRWDRTKGLEPIDLTLHEIKSVLASLAFFAQEAEHNTLDESFILSTIIEKLTDIGLSKQEARIKTNNLLETIRARSGVLIEVAPSIYQFVHLTFQEYLASIALTESDDFIDLILERYKDSRWQESIIFSIARIARSNQKYAEDAINVLLDTQSADGTIIASRSLIEIDHLHNDELLDKVTTSLAQLAKDTKVADSLKDTSRSILEELSKTQNKEG